MGPGMAIGEGSFTVGTGTIARYPPPSCVGPYLAGDYYVEEMTLETSITFAMSSGGGNESSKSHSEKLAQSEWCYSGLLRRWLAPRSFGRAPTFVSEIVCGQIVARSATAPAPSARQRRR